MWTDVQGTRLTAAARQGMLSPFDIDVRRRLAPSNPAVGSDHRLTCRMPGRLEVTVARATEALAIVGAGAAGAALAVLLIGGSLLLILPVVAVVGLITFVASARHH